MILNYKSLNFAHGDWRVWGVYSIMDSNDINSIHIHYFQKCN